MLDIEKFSPATADLQTLVEKSKLVTKESTPEEIHEMRMTLVKTRTSITKEGKAWREDAVKFQKAVIKKEEELIAVIKPEEDRLDALEELVEVEKQREERKALLPQRRARIEALEDGEEIPGDDFILDMESPDFEGYLNQRLAAKNKRDQDKLDADKKKLAEEREALDREKEIEVAKEKARIEERERIEREEKEKKDREAREKKESEDRAAREKLEKEEREAREEAEMRKNQRITAYLTEMGWTKELEQQGRFKIDRLDGGNKIVLWKRVGTFENLDDRRSE